MARSSEQALEDDDLDLQYRTLSPWLKRKLAARLGTAGVDIEDLTQESFIRLGRYSSADRSRHPRALLLRIAANLALDGLRRARARGHGRQVEFDDAEVQSAPSLVNPADQAFLIDLKRTILELPDHLRDTFLLARFTPMTHRQIAAQLGISTKTVEWRIKQAVSICLERLGR